MIYILLTILMTGIDFIGILLLSILDATHNIPLYHAASLTAKFTELGIGIIIRKIRKRKSNIQAIPKEIRRLNPGRRPHKRN